MSIAARELNAQPAEFAPALSKWRICFFVLLILFLNVQLDGLPLGHAPARQQLLLLPFTITFCVILLRLLWPPAAYAEGRSGVVARFLNLFDQPGFLLVITTVLFAGAGILFYAESRYFGRFGYHLHRIGTVLVFLTGIAALTGNFVGKHRVRTSGESIPSSQALFFTILVSYLAVSLLSIWSFPLTAQRSDMLPLLVDAGQSLLAHKDPYRAYQFVTGNVFLTYLPGTILSYFPAVALHVDVRFTNLLFTLVLAILIYRQTRPAFRMQAALLLALFLLSPYVLYRHEIYTSPHWLLIIGSILLLQRNRYLWASLLFGLSISVSQFSWILLPFFLLYLWQSSGLKIALQAASVTLLAAASVFLPFIAFSPRMFYGIFSHWAQMGVNARPINFSWYAAQAVGRSHLAVLQLILLAAIFGYCVFTRSCRDLPGCLRWMTLALTGFILLNFLIWGYFFLLVELLLILYILSANTWLSDEARFADDRIVRPLKAG